MKVYQLQKVFRSTCQNSLSSPAYLLATRGGKKKKAAAATAAPLSTDIVNIWKDREDPKVHPSEAYPPWLMELVREKHYPMDVMWQLYRGERIPNGKE